MLNWSGTTAAPTGSCWCCPGGPAASWAKAWPWWDLLCQEPQPPGVSTGKRIFRPNGQRHCQITSCLPVGKSVSDQRWWREPAQLLSVREFPAELPCWGCLVLLVLVGVSFPLGCLPLLGRGLRNAGCRLLSSFQWTIIKHLPSTSFLQPCYP